jgi:hypothetical protein
METVNGDTGAANGDRGCDAPSRGALSEQYVPPVTGAGAGAGAAACGPRPDGAVVPEHGLQEGRKAGGAGGVELSEEEYGKLRAAIGPEDAAGRSWRWRDGMPRWHVVLDGLQFYM